MILVIWTNLLDLTDMVNLMNLEILLTWIDFDGSVESGGSGGPFKFGDSDDTGKFGDLGRYGGRHHICQIFLHKHIFKNLKIYPKKVRKLRHLRS